VEKILCRGVADHDHSRLDLVQEPRDRREIRRVDGDEAKRFADLVQSPRHTTVAELGRITSAYTKDIMYFKDFDDLRHRF